jgi:NADH-quinone oxidoreductase subunit A
MFESYLPIAIMILMAIGMAAGIFIASWIAGIVKNSQTSREVYECGMPLLDEAEKRVSIRYYLVVLLFILFDVETLLLFPLVAAYREMVQDPTYGGLALLEIVLFIFILFLGYIYIFKKGALKWE